MIAFLTSKAGIYAVLVAVLVFGGWHARGVWEGNKIRAHLERAIEQANQQAKEDAELLGEAAAAETEIQIKFVEVERDAHQTPLCRDGGADFIRLYGRAIDAANSE